jgi:hypothetical protein
MRIRYLKPGFFQNEILAECDMAARLFFEGLWVCADREGRVENRPKRLKINILPYDDCDVIALLDQLEQRGFIQRYSVDGNDYIVICQFAKHQKVHHKEPPSVLPPPPGETQSEPLPAANKTGKNGADPLLTPYSPPTGPLPTAWVMGNGEWVTGNGERVMGNGDGQQPSTTEDREAEAVAQVPVAMQIAKALHLDTYTGEQHRKVAQTLFLARSRLPQLLTLARRERAEYSFASATFDQKMGVLERLVRRVTETAPTQPPPRIAPVIPFPERKEEFPSTGEAAWAEVVEFCQDSARKGLGRDGRGTDFLRIAGLQFLSADNEAKIIRLAGYLQGTRPFDTMVVNAINSTRGAFGWTPEIEWHHQAAEVVG